MIKVCVQDIKQYSHVVSVLVRFNGFFDEDSTQETLYHNSVCPLIPYVIQGQNASVFAYGPTGAGLSLNEVTLKHLMCSSKVVHQQMLCVCYVQCRLLCRP